ncbi:hypothetical protein B7P43_G07344 [Cryptotermes secundus]|uniref:Uncharacterized protein n=1 Tax=Cryptotermes secundus TaxID=105785 RepID=A0A2J7PN03_9NEOP|nr:hypothetical protein B7P43_G07344 [Cryptotermes secundus]
MGNKMIAKWRSRFKAFRKWQEQEEKNIKTIKRRREEKKNVGENTRNYEGEGTAEDDECEVKR